MYLKPCVGFNTWVDLQKLNRLSISGVEQYQSISELMSCMSTSIKFSPLTSFVKFSMINIIKMTKSRFLQMMQIFQYVTLQQWQSTIGHRQIFMLGLYQSCKPKDLVNLKRVGHSGFAQKQNKDVCLRFSTSLTPWYSLLYPYSL